MAKWYNVMRRTDFSIKNKRFYSSRDMMEIKRVESIRNSQAKRVETTLHKGIYVCGCGTEGCFVFS